ncbi:MAG: hypothetical protein KC619_18045 [Myxococcales bacterium]|nr:hypothetical protein [Myxococcales bacterium]
MAAVFLALAAAPARAQPEVDGPARAEARRITQRATRHYEHHRYELALEGYQRAHGVYPVPGLLFNMAQCHRELGQHELAIQRLEQYLDERPDAPNRALVLDLLAESRAALTESRARATEARASETAAALSAELERQRAALAEVERARLELERAREAGEERREEERLRYETAYADLEAARRELEAAQRRLDAQQVELSASPEVYEEWWFWTLVVAAVAVVAGGITLGVVLTQEPGLPSGSLGTIDLR